MPDIPLPDYNAHRNGNTPSACHPTLVLVAAIVVTIAGSVLVMALVRTAVAASIGSMCPPFQPPRHPLPQQAGRLAAMPRAKV